MINPKQVRFEIGNKIIRCENHNNFIVCNGLLYPEEQYFAVINLLKNIYKGMR